MQNLRRLSRWLALSLCLTALAAPAAAEVAVDILERSRNSVAFIRVGSGVGTGFIIDSQHIATNAHVIGSTPAGGIQINTGGGTDTKASRIVVRNTDLDLAILQVPGLKGRQVIFAQGELPVGASVYTVGFPTAAQLQGFPVSLGFGNVSSVRRNVTWSANAKQRLSIIQHSATTNPGNSGGPLMNRCGHVVGVATRAALQFIPGTRTRFAAGQDIYWASEATEIRRLLDSKGIKYNIASGPCSPDAGLADKLRAETQAMEEEMRATQEAIAQEMRETQQELVERAETMQREQQAKAEEQQEILEEAIDTAETQASLIQYQWLIFGAAFVVVFGLIIMLLLRKPRERIVRVVEDTRERLTSLIGAPPGLESYGERTILRDQINEVPTAILTLQGGDNRKLTIRGDDLANETRGISIGSDKELVDRAISGRDIAPRHARIHWRTGRFYMEDLNSSAGTVIDDATTAPFRPVALQDGSRIKLGPWEFLFETETSS